MKKTAMEIQESQSPDKYLEEGRKGKSPGNNRGSGSSRGGLVSVYERLKSRRLSYVAPSDGLGYRELILDPRGPFLKKWTMIFVLSCIVALLFDPLFFYIPVIDDGKKCIGFDRKLEIIAIVLRSFTDVIYIMHIVFQFRTGYIIAPPQDSVIELVKDAGAIAKQYLVSYFMIDILAVLPLPQAIVLVIIPRVKDQRFLDAKNLLKFAILLQYVPRVIRIYPLYRKATWTSASLSKTAWTKAAFNLFLFIHASHVLGAFWYFFSIERATAFWHIACKNNAECVNNSFYCGDSLIKETHLADYCPIKTPNTTLIDFGIFHDALQSGIVESSDFPQKLIRCFWWGLQSLSSLGQNLSTSNYVWENCFAIIVTFTGLFLFLCVLGNLQLYLQFTTMKSEETRLEGRALEIWMASHSIPDDLRSGIRQYHHYRKQESSGVDVEKLFRSIPKGLANKVKQQLCLGLLTRVPVFGKMDNTVLDAISKRLKPALYEEDCYVVQAGYPVEEMLFIVKGKIATAAINGKTSFLKDGDFFGDEIINWALHPPKSSGLPISSRTVQALTKVEGFSLTPNDLKIVVSQYWWQFCKKLNLPSTDNLARSAGKKQNTTYWEAMAATAIQSIWRRRYNRKKLTPRLAIEYNNEK